MYCLRKKIKRLIPLILSAILFCTLGTSCRESSKKDNVVSLTVSTTEEQSAIISAMAEAFNTKNSDIKVSVKVYTAENEKNYYLSHAEDFSELVTFNYAQEAIYNRDYLLKLDRMSVINRYSVSIMNYLKDYEGSLYALPANGRYYTRIYNKDALDAYGLAVPQTISELLTFAARLKETASASEYYASATLGGNSSMLFALMSVAYPLFLNTVRGTAFLNGVLNGELSFNDPEYKESWREVFEYFKLLYDNNFYSLSSVTKTAQEELEYFKSGKAAAKQNDGNVSLKDLFEKVNGECAPFVGKTERDACIGSTPFFYLSLSKRADESYEKQFAAKKFLAFFASAEGQEFVNEHLKNDEYVSYIKGVDVSSAIYEPVADREKVGMLFINDSFNYAFGYCVSDLYDYLNSRTSLDSLLNIVDEKIREGHNSEFYTIAEIDKKYELTDSMYRENSELGEFLVSSIAKASYLDCAVIPSSYIKCPLLKGTLTENDLEAVFPEKNLCYAEISAQDFLTLCLYINVNDSYPLIYGATLQDGKLYKKNGRAYDPSERIYTLIPADKKEVLSGSAIIGSDVTTKTLLFSYFRVNNIVTK